MKSLVNLAPQVYERDKFLQKVYKRDTFSLKNGISDSTLLVHISACVDLQITMRDCTGSI